MTVKHALIIATTLLTAAGCGMDGDISRTLQIVIPREMPSAQGTLYLSLWSYDGVIADGSATQLDVEQTSFQHTAGQVTAVFLHVSGRSQDGWKHYLTVEGCAAGAGRVFSAFVSGTSQTLAIVEPQATPTPCGAGN